MSPKVLVVATWGYPPSWRRCVYRVRITNERFKAFLTRGAGISEELLNDFRLESCCSTIAILSLLGKSGNLETHALIFGSDSVINPSTVKDGRELREAVRGKYREWFSILARTSAEVGNAEPGLTQGIREPEFVILPGVGNYYGWHFEGSVDHLFLKAYHAILRKLSNEKYSYVAIDLTHGINFQTISVLYALIAAALTLDKEDKLVLLNSEPALPATEPCIKEGKLFREPIPPQLSILDVTKLQSIIKLIRILRNVTSLNPLKLGDIQKELEEEESKDVLEKVENLIKFTNLLANGVVALTYPNAYCMENEELRQLGKVLNPCVAGVSSTETDPTTPEYLPEIRVNESTIKYKPANAYKALDTAIPKILEERICSQLLTKEATKDLAQYLNNAKRLLEKKGHICLKLVANQAESELKDFTEYITKCVTGKLSDNLCREIKKELKTTNNEIVVPAQTLRKLYENKALITNLLQGEKNKPENTNKQKRTEPKPKKKEASETGNRTIRNLCAHAGLEHDLIKHITIETNTRRKPPGKITIIIYTNCKTIKEILQTLT